MGEDAAESAGKRPGRRFLAGFDRVSDWTDVCVDLLRADGAAVVASSAQDPDVRRVLHTTDARASRTADLLYVLGAGPHADTMAGGTPHTLVVDDPTDAVRWPLLVLELAALGVKWVHVFPLGHSVDPIGTLQLLGTTVSGAPVPGDAEILVAKLARLIGTDIVAGAITADFGDGENDDPIHLAIGILLVRHAITSDAASAMLRADAYAAGRTATEQARVIVDAARGTVDGAAQN